MHRHAPRRAALALTFAVFVPTTAFGQQDGNIERGFASGKSYQAFEGLDSVNVFNGNLGISIPFPGFHVNGALGYGLTLTYNAKIWNLFSAPEVPGGPPVPYAELNEMDNSGAGWLLTLGELLHPSDPRNVSGNLVYVGPDGGEHRFYDTLHLGETVAAGKCYARGGSYLRLNAPGINCAFGGSPIEAEVEFPGGQVQRFTRPNGSSSFRLVEIRDRFGNAVTVTYFTNPTRWRLQDGHRTHWVYFKSVAGREVVDRVDLAAFGGTTASYSFGYTAASIPEHCGDEHDGTPATRQVPLLTSVTLPAGGGSYLMNGAGDYYATCQDGGETIDDLPGVLHRLKLPTRGTLEWSYQRHLYVQRGIPQPGEPTLEVTETLGVETRKLIDAAGATVGTWTYAASAPGQAPVGERWVRVTYPTGDETVFHFSTPQTLSNATWTGWEYGLPFRKSATSGAGYFLSQEIYEGSAATGVKHRSIYLGYEHDRLPLSAEVHQDWYATNRRVVREKTVYHLDGNREATAVYSQFDGLGHYRRRDLGGTFPTGGNTRTDITDFNPAQGVYFVNPSTNVQSPGYTPWSPSSPWVLGTFESRQTTEGGQTSREEYCFQGSTGHLLRRRVLENGTAPGANDLVFLFSRDGAGNTIREQRYGSDLGSVGSGAICSIGLGAEQLRMDHTYQHGSLATSRYFNPNGSAVSFLSVNRTIDRNTGLSSSARDPALVTTTFDYDALGRPTSVAFGDDATTFYLYNLGQGTGFARVRTRRFQGPALLADELLFFDHFGRPAIEKRLLASGAWSKRRTFYNAVGWVTDVSEWEPDAGAFTAFARYRDFDPFGRPGRIEPPDAAAHQVDLDYFGAREVRRTVRVATGAGGAETTATTTERYDRQGRLVQVVEPSGAGGANVTTTYGYDEGGRLSSVGMGGTQFRSFSYDNRGLPTSECHPEKGASGNGCVTYSLYNAWGQPGRAADGPNDLRLIYDRAGRPTLIRETGGQQRTLKEWSYGTGTGAADRSNGKVKTAGRYNYVFLGATPYTVLVREAYTYGGRSGRVSTRLTENFINPQPGSSPSDSFTQSFVWNDLGDPASLVYPSRLGLPVGRTVSFGYTNGMLTSVPGYASSITYHPNGMLNQVVHTNDVTDVWGQDPSKMQRPSSIAAWFALGTPSAAVRFSSGTYGYDGSGNVETIGNAYFVYDKVSRLVDARLFTGPGGGGGQVQQSYSFDAFGNIQSITTNSSTRNTPTSSTTNRLTSGAYDAAGNLTGYTGALYEYGAFNDIWHYQNGAEEAIYLYTAGGERLWEFNLNGKNRWTLRDLGGKVLREYSYDRGTAVWTVERDYIYRNGALLAAETPQGIRHLTIDHLGTPRLVTNTFGNQVAYHLYYPFGEEATFFNQDGERMKFTGHERDLNSTAGPGDDLDYMHARFHSPLTGRFLTADPIGGSPWLAQSWNRYSYVLGNPVNYIDPYGLDERAGGNEYHEDTGATFYDVITVTSTPIDHRAWQFWNPYPPSFPTRRPRGGGGGGAGNNSTASPAMLHKVPREGEIYPESDPCSGESVVGNFLSSLNIQPAIVIGGRIGSGLGFAGAVKLTTDKVSVYGGAGLVLGASLNALFGISLGETKDGAATKASLTGSQLPAGFSGTISATAGDGKSAFFGIGPGGGWSASWTGGRLNTLQEWDLGVNPWSDPCN